jgi:hypothetical protein
MSIFPILKGEKSVRSMTAPFRLSLVGRTRRPTSISFGCEIDARYFAT